MNTIDNANARKRIRKEMNENNKYNFEIADENNLLYKIKTQIKGQEFVMDISISPNYPFKACTFLINDKELKQIIYELDQEYFWLHEKNITYLHEILGNNWTPANSIVKILDNYETLIPLFDFSKKTN